MLVSLLRLDDRGLDRSARAQHRERDLLAVPADLQIRRGTADLKIAQDDLVEELRQARGAEAGLEGRG